MPLPLGHTAIGWAVYHTTKTSATCEEGQIRASRRARMAFVAVLASLPDLDVLFGLLIYGNGAAVHRGPTHSLLFAIVAGFLASCLWRFWNRVPQVGFGLCFSLVFSHVMADMLLTSSPVSLFWPLEIYFSSGLNGWWAVMHMVLFKSVQDIGIVVLCLVYVYGLRFLRARAAGWPLFAFARSTAGPCAIGKLTRKPAVK